MFKLNMKSQKKSLYFLVFKITSILLVALYFFKISKNADEWNFLNNIHLIIHEAGHTFFMFFNDFWNIAGGTIFQVLVPSLFIIYFISKKQIISASLLFFWAGHSLINISVYAKDAISMSLPLLGGENSIHDWNYLLSNLGILNYTNKIYLAINSLGFIFIALATFLSIYLIIKKYNFDKFNDLNDNLIINPNLKD